jgi:hypothetical protein
MVHHANGKPTMYPGMLAALRDDLERATANVEKHARRAWIGFLIVCGAAAVNTALALYNLWRALGD